VSGRSVRLPRVLVLVAFVAVAALWVVLTVAETYQACLTDDHVNPGDFWVLSTLTTLLAFGWLAMEERAQHNDPPFTLLIVHVLRLVGARAHGLLTSKDAVHASRGHGRARGRSAA
jgi:hypothetical protein